jgi:hypothetical protein
LNWTRLFNDGQHLAVRIEKRTSLGEKVERRCHSKKSANRPCHLHSPAHNSTDEAMALVYNHSNLLFLEATYSVVLVRE